MARHARSFPPLGARDGERLKPQDRGNDRQSSAEIEKMKRPHITDLAASAAARASTSPAVPAMAKPHAPATDSFALPTLLPAADALTATVSTGCGALGIGTTAIVSEPLFLWLPEKALD